MDPILNKKGTGREPNFEQKGDPNNVKGASKGDPKFNIFRTVHKEKIVKKVKIGQSSNSYKYRDTLFCFQQQGDI